LTADPLDRAKALLDEGRLEAALAITGPLVEAGGGSHRALALHSTGLKGLGRHEDALAVDRQAAARFPGSGVAWHNLAATLGDLGRGEESARAMAQGMSLGLDGALSWGVMARARAASGDLDGAEQAYLEALRRAPGRFETAREYAEVVWMRRGDLDEAQQILDRAAHAGGPPAPLLIAKAKLYEAAEQQERADALLRMAVERLPDDPLMLLGAAQAELERGSLDEAERLVRRAETIAPDLPTILNHLAIVQIAKGQSDLALATARRGLELAPEDQSLWGWAATAARAAGDPLHHELCDYPKMVGAYDLEAPAGWADIGAFLADLGAALDRIHLYDLHPSGQSLRHGSQTTYRLTGSDDPTIQAFFRAVDAPIRRHIESIGPGTGPLHSRRSDGYRISGAWSVRLRPGGFHKDHFHPEGWLSSAFYVQTPDAALETPDRQGWIRFGQPPFRSDPPLPAEHFVRPKPGRLVLFPSYMWHGTVPFTTDEKRMTIAFDVAPV
jgi:uncharacterized protein (TIGR02466 family)